MDRLCGVDGRMLVVADFSSTRLSDDSDFMLYRGDDPRDEAPAPLQPVQSEKVKQRRGYELELRHALFHWLQMQIVCEARPKDRSAKETMLFFEEALREDHQVTQLQKKGEQEQYVIRFRKADEEQTQTFSRTTAEQLLQDILAEPKYQLSFEDG
jgi:hypothetical protein